MRITIYNANDSEENLSLDHILDQLKEELGFQHEIHILNLREMNLKFCTGCWSCWVKTPGECIIKDDMQIIHRSFINSDLVIFASPMRMGFPNALTKKVHDRLVPLVHPYIEMVEGESHHISRYDRYPSWGLILKEEKQGSAEDVELVKAIYERTSLNIKSKLAFTCTSKQNIKEISYEINHL